MATTAAEWNPAYYYLINRFNSLAYYSSYDGANKYFLYNLELNDLAWPIPNIADTTHEGFFEYWSSIFEWPPLRALSLFSLFAIIPCSLLLIYFIDTWMKDAGSAGFAYVNDAANRDDLTTMSW